MMVMDRSTCMDSAGNVNILHEEVVKNGGSHPAEMSKKVIIVDSLEEAMKKIKEHELENAVRFSVFCSRKGFGETDLYSRKHKVMWQDENIEFTGVPFFIVNQKTFDCQHGVDRNKAVKERKKTERQIKSNGHSYRTISRRSIKVECPCKVHIKEIIEFPEYKISEDTKNRRVRASKNVRTAIENKATGTAIRKFVVTIPDASEHQFHAVGEEASISKEADPYVVDKIEFLVEERVTSIEEEEQHPEDTDRKRRAPANIYDDYESHEDEDSVEINEVPKKRASSGHAIRELLSEISELLYLVDDKPDGLAEVYNQLLRARQKLISALEEKGLSLDQSKATESSEEKNPEVRPLGGQKRVEKYMRSVDERSQKNEKVSTVNIEESVFDECTIHRRNLGHSDDADMSFASPDKVCWSNVDY